MLYKNKKSQKVYLAFTYDDDYSDWYRVRIRRLGDNKEYCLSMSAFHKKYVPLVRQDYDEFSDCLKTLSSGNQIVLGGPTFHSSCEEVILSN